jgi:D-3-phosphoglycerate dehydrogenase
VAPRAIVINTSRGSTIDEDALLAAIDEKGLRVGLDVFPDEPKASRCDFDSRLARHPSVVGSHHIGASTEQAQRSIVEGTIEVIRAYSNGELLHCVNLQRAPRRAATIVVRHIDQVGVLAEVLAVLRTAQLNVQEMNNRVFAGASAAVATIELSGVPSADDVAAVAAIPAVVGVHVQEAS